MRSSHRATVATTTTTAAHSASICSPTAPLPRSSDAQPRAERRSVHVNIVSTGDPAHPPSRCTGLAPSCKQQLAEEATTSWMKEKTSRKESS
jgi:hypothetical protein